MPHGNLTANAPSSPSPAGDRSDISAVSQAEAQFPPHELARLRNSFSQLVQHGRLGKFTRNTIPAQALADELKLSLPLEALPCPLLRFVMEHYNQQQQQQHQQQQQQSRVAVEALSRQVARAIAADVFGVRFRKMLRGLEGKKPRSNNTKEESSASWDGSAERVAVEAIEQDWEAFWMGPMDGASDESEDEEDEEVEEKEEEGKGDVQTGRGDVSGSDGGKRDSMRDADGSACTDAGGSNLQMRSFFVTDEIRQSLATASGEGEGGVTSAGSGSAHRRVSRRTRVTWEEFIVGLAGCCKEASSAARMKRLLRIMSLIRVALIPPSACSHSLQSQSPHSQSSSLDQNDARACSGTSHQNGELRDRFPVMPSIPCAPSVPQAPLSTADNLQGETQLHPQSQQQQQQGIGEGEGREVHAWHVWLLFLTCWAMEQQAETLGRDKAGSGSERGDRGGDVDVGGGGADAGLFNVAAHANDQSAIPSSVLHMLQSLAQGAVSAAASATESAAATENAAAISLPAPGASSRSAYNESLPRLESTKLVSWLLVQLPGLSTRLSAFVLHRFATASHADDSFPSTTHDVSKAALTSDAPAPASSLSASHSASPTVTSTSAVSAESTDSTNTSPEAMPRGVAWVLDMAFPNPLSAAGMSRAGAAGVAGATEATGAAGPAPGAGAREARGAGGGHMVHGAQLLYRASLHGRGIRRLMAQAEGYGGPWGCALMQLSPSFALYKPTGQASNFICTPSAKLGGGLGRERVWVDEEFRSAIVRHHAVDKTFRAGHLHPDQGYAELSVRVEDVTVWGLGGKVAEDKRVAFQQREQLFTEQRRKVDLAKFVGKWEDAPERVMLYMVTNPNKPSKEER
ncbi:unnamed protein product [Closterium sp. Yama58-4]|nr:unnamed protein product [Closterium sp. Yama58-4]